MLISEILASRMDEFEVRVRDLLADKRIVFRN